MAKLGKQWIDLNPASAAHLGSADLPHSSTLSVGAAIDALNTPGLHTEYFTLTPADITAKRVRLTLTCARRESAVVGVCHGPNQRYGVDFIVSADSPNYVYWDGLAMQEHLAAGDQIFVIYEVENQTLGTYSESGDTPTPAPSGMPSTERIFDDYTVTKAVSLMVDTTAKGVYVQLPSASAHKDATVLIKIIQGGNDVTIAPQGADLIDQANEEIVIDEIGASYTLVCDGQGWFVV